MLKIKKGILIGFFCLFSIYSFNVYSKPENSALKNTIAFNEFEKLFSDWTDAFNNKDLKQTCALFANSVIANYQGVPPKNYGTICGGFNKVFQQKKRKYHYQFKLHHVYVRQNIAIARITWTLKIYKNGKVISKVQDEGIDVLQKNAKGEWEIIEYLAYPVRG